MGYAGSIRSAQSVGWAEDQGRRDEMEDGFVFVDCFGSQPASAFLGIYDGHGGRQCVDYITEHLHENMLTELQSAGSDPRDARPAICRAFATTDTNLWKSGVTQSGCTACCCLIREEPTDWGTMEKVLYAAHIGDARVVLCKSGSAERLTSMSDHKATDPTEQQRVIEAGGSVFNERVNGMLAISRAFGDHQLKIPTMQQDIVSNQPEIQKVVLNQNHMFVVLACDGLWDVMSDQEVVSLALVGMQDYQRLVAEDMPDRSAAMGEVMARMLVLEALNRGTSDNVTCSILFF